MTEKIIKTAGRTMNGFDAYEHAWDGVSKHLWSVLCFNFPWFCGFVAVVFIVFLFTRLLSDSWPAFYLLSFFLFLVVAPVWEGANILRFGEPAPSTTGESGLPVFRIIIARLLFLMIVVPAYLFFILPGIYFHCRFSLFLPVLLFSPKLSPMDSLLESWRLTRSRFVSFYTLWIAVVVSKPVCLLPFGLGFLVERPICGLAKHILFTHFFTHHPRDGPS